ncbi:hypothetical protein QTN25_003840 [Entamoeba marina]
MDDMKINPLIKDVSTSFIFKYFPFIETIQVSNLLQVIPKKYLENITFIQVCQPLLLFQWNNPGSNYEFMQMIDDGSTPYYINKNYVYDLRNDFSPLTLENRKEKYDNETDVDNCIVLGDMIYWKVDIEYIERIKNINIHSLETLTFLMKNIDNLKGLNTLRIVLENENMSYRNRNNDDDDDNINNNLISYVDVLKNLRKLKSLRRIELIDINAEVSPIIQKTINDNMHLQFIISFYEYNNKQVQEYTTLNNYNNVHIQFMQFFPDCIQNGFITSSYYPNVKSSKLYDDFDLLRINSKPFSKSINGYKQVFDSMYRSPTLDIKYNGEIPDIQNLYTENMIIQYLKTTTFFPNTLKYLTLNSASFNNGKIDLSNCNLSKLTLNNCTSIYIKVPSTIIDVIIYYCSNLDLTCSTAVALKSLSISGNNPCSFVCSESTGSQYYFDGSIHIIENIQELSLSEVKLAKTMITNIESIIASSVTINGLIINTTYIDIEFDDYLRNINFVYNENESYFTLVNVEIYLSLNGVNVKKLTLKKCKISLLELSNTVEELTLTQCKLTNIDMNKFNDLKKVLVV